MHPSCEQPSCGPASTLESLPGALIGSASRGEESHELTLVKLLCVDTQARTEQAQRSTRCQAAATEEAPAAEALSQRLQIKLKSFDIGLLDLSVEEIMQVANNTGELGAC